MLTKPAKTQAARGLLDNSGKMGIMNMLRSEGADRSSLVFVDPDLNSRLSAKAPSLSPQTLLWNRSTASNRST